MKKKECFGEYREHDSECLNCDQNVACEKEDPEYFAIKGISKEQWEVYKAYYDDCKGFITGKCKKCSYFEICKITKAKWTVRMPQFITDKYLSLLSGNQFKVFFYLCSKAKFKQGKNFGKCFPTYEQIAEHAGVGKYQVKDYLVKLKARKLIKHNQITIRKNDGSIKTINDIEITFFDVLADIKAA